MQNKCQTLWCQAPRCLAPFRSRGFTLVELLASIAIMSIIAGLDVMLLRTGVDSWTHSATRLDLQKASDELMENLLEGGLEGEGIRDAVELKQADFSAIGFVPLWTDKSHRPEPVHNKEQKFTLEEQFKAGSPTPIGQVRKEGSKDFVVVPVKFTYGPSQDPKAPDDVVQFTDPIPAGSELRILYTPDAASDPDAAKIFRWDPATKRIYESYAGKTRDILLHSDAVKVERCAFLYYDNLNRLQPFAEGSSLSSLALKRVTAVKLYLLLRLRGESKELTSFTNVRNVASIGATVAEGAQLPMPKPDVIKAFSIGDFYGEPG
ncbi:MAG: prepilin-type N-terminal cleavage/methylation domain-containing protein [Candidatus Omnitrophica bacterium]|nr:prepilin-type N-terminal cleavage/methylation domain-containing protein [Candidatus Omnitrophota bacterium]